MAIKRIKKMIRVLNHLQMFLLGGVGGIVTFILIMTLTEDSKLIGTGIISLLFLIGSLMIIKLNIILLKLDIREKKIQMFIQEPIQKI